MSAEMLRTMSIVTLSLDETWWQGGGGDEFTSSHSCTGRRWVQWMSNSSFNNCTSVIEQGRPSWFTEASTEEGCTAWFADRASLGKRAYVLIRPSLDPEDERFSLHQHFFTLGADLRRTVSCSRESCVCTGSAGVERFEAGTLLTTTTSITQGGVHRGVSVPVRHAPALGAVRCRGAEHWVRTQPTACSAVDCLHAAVLPGATRRITQDEKAWSSEESPGRTVAWITMREMFLKCFFFPL